MFDLPEPRPRVPYRRLHVTSDDGVPLGVQTVGEGPPVLLANGIGVTAPGLDYIADHLRQRHRVISWDYRGTGQSPVGRHDVELGMPRHAADALNILDALGEPRAVVVGWSMGVPVGLEMIRRAPERVAALAALFGCPGTPFRSAFRRPLSDLVHLLVRFSVVAPGPAQALLRLGVSLPPVTWLVCTGTGFCGPRANREVFLDHVRSTAAADKRAYFGTMAEMMHHDARDLLPEITCPVLVVTGERDWVTPTEAALSMAELIPGARHVVYPETSHFGVIEHGVALWEPLDQLLARAGMGRP